MVSPNLNIAHVAGGQTDKETTINDAVDALDNATQGNTTHNMSATTVVTVPASTQRAYAVHRAQSFASVRTLKFQAISRIFTVVNEGTYDLGVQVSSVVISVVVASTVQFWSYASGLRRYK